MSNELASSGPSIKQSKQSDLKKSLEKSQPASGLKDSMHESLQTFSSKPLAYPDGIVNVARKERSLPKTASQASGKTVVNQGETFKQIEHLEEVNEET